MECFLDAYDPNTSTTPFGVFKARSEVFDIKLLQNCFFQYNFAFAAYWFPQ